MTGGRFIAWFGYMRIMNIYMVLALLLLCFGARAQKIVIGGNGERFRVCTVASGLSDPWEVSYGPDGYLWVTEARGYRVSRIHVATGVKTVLLDLTTMRGFPRYDLIAEEKSDGKPWPQSGLMGMALHPNLLKGSPYVYIAYLYAFEGAQRSGDGCLPGLGGCFFTTRIARYIYDSAAQRLTNPVIVCDTIPGSNDHNAGRLLIAPSDNDWHLFYTVGDMGAGQYGNAGRANHAQSIDSYEGKILRFNTHPDQDSGLYDRWIPNDNPFNGTRQTAVWSYGHRNAQGLGYAMLGDSMRLYAAEHGPFSDDEVNLIEKGKNYGHPLVIGFNDNNYNQLSAGITKDSSLPGPWHTSYPLIKSEQENAAAIGPALYRNPMVSFYPVSNDSLTRLFHTLQSADTTQPDWPSEAPSGIEVYASTAIPGWQPSLLMTTLKGGQLIRIQLNKTGSATSGAPVSYFKAAARYRDLAVSSDGSTIFLATDSSTVSSGPAKSRKSALPEQRGCILSFTYIGQEPATKPQVPPRGTRQKPFVKKAGRSRGESADR